MSIYKTKESVGNDFSSLFDPPFTITKGTGLLQFPDPNSPKSIKIKQKIDGFSAKDLIKLLNNPQARPGIAPTAYDTAWLASIPSEDDLRLPMFPSALQWLLENQSSDGSWGGKIQYEHDRILCTLAALVPIKQFCASEHVANNLKAGIRYLWQHGHLLSNEPTELVAFELLLPTMVKRAQNLGIPVPPNLDIYTSQRAEKMKLIPAGALYSPRVTIVHSLEFLGEQADVSGLRAAQGINGSIGNSPAATAFYYSQTKDPKALSYLHDCMDQSGGAKVPVLYPCENYELLWSAYHLYLAGVPVSSLLNEQQTMMLKNALNNGGVSLSPSFPIPDADDTAVALLFLHELGQSPDPKILEYYATPDGHFASFQYERHSSVGVSLHVLHALLRVPGYPGGQRTITRLLDYLASQQIDGLYWIDKWHISPYYATAHALCILTELDSRMAFRMRPLIEQSREWIRNTQNQDGSWGFYNQPTLEETAYALLALAASTPTPLSSEDRRSCEKAVYYLQTKLKEAPVGSSADLFPPLWIDKCLYRPALIVQAVIAAALEAYKKISTEEHLNGVNHEVK